MVEARGQAGFQHTSGMEVVHEVAEVSIKKRGIFGMSLPSTS